MIKGGYTYLDLSSVTLGDETPTTIPGIYQKCVDTYGKLAIITTAEQYGAYKIMCFAIKSDAQYGFMGYAILEGVLTAIAYFISSDDTVLSYVYANDGE